MAFNPYAASKKRGEKGSSLFSFLKTDAKFFKLDKEGKFAIDIIPYKIATKNHPAVISGDAEIGDQTYVLDVFVHKSVGPKKATVICPNKSFGKKCPICEAYEIAKKEKGFDSPEAKALKPQQRVVYNIVNVDDPDSGVQLFEASYFTFEKELLEQAEADAPDFDLDFIPFGSANPGFTLKFRTTEETFNGNKFYSPKDFKFKERKNGAIDEYLDDANSLDKLMIIHSYDEITALFYGADDEDDEEEVVEEETPRKRKPSDDDDDDEPPKKKATPEKEESDKPKCFGDPDKFDELPTCSKCELWTDCRKAVRAK